jgi:hypothetical protein
MLPDCSVRRQRELVAGDNAVLLHTKSVSDRPFTQSKKAIAIPAEKMVVLCI